MRLLIATTLLAATACATPAAETPSEPASAGGGSCSAEGLDDLVGRDPTTERGAEALRRSGARALRWIRPGDMVTMDFREDRLNIHLDARHKVERLACG